MLRHDNADLRLTEIGHRIGLISEDRYERFLTKKQAIQNETERLAATIIKPNETTQAYLREWGSSELKDGIRGNDLLRRTELSYKHISQLIPAESEVPEDVAEQVEIQVKYEGYIEKSIQQVEKLKKMENKRIPDLIDYDAITGLASEARQKLKQVRPLSMAQASRISGVNPADISILLVYIEQGKIAKIPQN